MYRFLLLLGGIAGGLLVAIAAYFPLFHIFVRMYPDCAPNQIDGQCGLATFMDALYAVGVASLVWLVVAIVLSRHVLRRLGSGRTREVGGN